MNETKNIHWSSDEELLARYVLNRLEAGERNALEAHLRTCKICQRAVRMEQELVAGIRRSGRDELKVRLRQRMGTPTREEHIPWRHILSAAAVVILIIGVGIYNHWFASHEAERGTTANEVLKQESTRDSKQLEYADAHKAEEKSKDIARSESPAPAKSLAGRASEASQPRGEESQVSGTKERGVRANKKRRRESMEAPQNAAGPAAGAAEVRGAVRADEKPAILDDRETSVAETFWVDGTLLPESRSEIGEPRDRVSEINARAKVLSKSEKDAGGFAQTKQFTIMQGANVQTLTLSQHPIQSLPVSRQKNQTMRDHETIQTRVERTPDGLHMTLYTDSLVEESALQNAGIQAITDDSLIVNLSNQRIGYRIPGGWNATQESKTKK